MFLLLYDVDFWTPTIYLKDYKRILTNCASTVSAEHLLEVCQLSGRAPRAQAIAHPAEADGSSPPMQQPRAQCMH